MISETELLAKVPTKLFIGGEWVDSSNADRSAAGKKSRNAKVHDFDVSVTIDHQILGLEVAMRDALCVSFTQPGANLPGNLDCAAKTERADAIQQ